MRRKGVAEEVRMDALGLQPRFGREPAENQERTCPRECASARVEEQLGPVPDVEERAATREVAANGFDCRPADRDDALLVALADRADDPRVEIDVGLAQTDRLAHPQARAVQKFDECAVAMCTGSRA